MREWGLDRGVGLGRAGAGHLGADPTDSARLSAPVRNASPDTKFLDFYFFSCRKASNVPATAVMTFVC